MKEIVGRTYTVYIRNRRFEGGTRIYRDLSYWRALMLLKRYLRSAEEIRISQK